MTATVLEYVREEKKSFQKRPFSHADALALSGFVFTHLEDIDKEILDFLIERGSTIRELGEHAYLPDLAYDVPPSNQLRSLAAAICSSPRFGTMPLVAFKTYESESPTARFAALALEVAGSPTPLIVVVFRGTEPAQEGWQEDFELVVTPEVPSEKLATEFLEGVSRLNPNARIVLTGLSKGGALSERALLFCASDVHEAIAEVISFDGNGIYRLGSQACPEFVDFDIELRHRYENSSVPVHKYLMPLMVGCFLADDDQAASMVVDSGRGIGHDIFTPCVCDGDIETKPFTASDRQRGQLLNRWVRSLSLEERHAVIDVVFALKSYSPKRFSFAGWQSLPGVAQSVLRGYTGVDATQRSAFRSAVSKIVKARQGSLL